MPRTCGDTFTLQKCFSIVLTHYVLCQFKCWNIVKGVKFHMTCVNWALGSERLILFYISNIFIVWFFPSCCVFFKWGAQILTDLLIRRHPSVSVWRNTTFVWMMLLTSATVDLLRLCSRGKKWKGVRKWKKPLNSTWKRNNVVYWDWYPPVSWLSAVAFMVKYLRSLWSSVSVLSSFPPKNPSGNWWMHIIILGFSNSTSPAIDTNQTWCMRLLTDIGIFEDLSSLNTVVNKIWKWNEICCYVNAI